MKENELFYQQEYEQGFTTEMPTDEALQEMLATRFENTPKDYSGYIRLLRALGLKPGDHILDFGCSWGYGTWQLSQAGFVVDGFEVSRSRCQYACDKLGVAAVDQLDQLDGPFDCVFSAHVIEHVPNVLEMLTFARSKLRPGGLFVAFTPNGDEQNRNREPEAWQHLWGQVHPQLIDSDFCKKQLAGLPVLIASRPVDLEQVGRWRQTGWEQLSLCGDELLLVFKNVVEAK